MIWEGAEDYGDTQRHAGINATYATSAICLFKRGAIHELDDSERVL